MKRTFDTTVAINVRVTLDDAHFNEAFMGEFRESFYPFHTLRRHVQHLAQLEARGMVHDYKPFVEGYGELEDMGISLNAVDFEVTECDEVVN